MNTFKFPNSEEKAIEALKELGITHPEGSPEDALISALKQHQDLNKRYPNLVEYVFSLTTWLQHPLIPQKELTQTDEISIQRMEDLGIVLSDMLQEKVNELNELNISNEDYVELSNANSFGLIQKLGLNPNYPVYHFPLTEESYTKLQNTPGVTKLMIEPDWLSSQSIGDNAYPLGGGKLPWR